MFQNVTIIMLTTNPIYQNTVFPRNLAATRFYFKALFGAAICPRQLDFEGGAYRDWPARTHEVSVIILFICTYNVHAHTCNSCQSFTVQWDFEGSTYGMSWQEHAATFRGWRGFEVLQNFKEIWYVDPVFELDKSTRVIIIYQLSDITESWVCIFR